MCVVDAVSKDHMESHLRNGCAGDSRCPLSRGAEHDVVHMNGAESPIVHLSTIYLFLFILLGKSVKKKNLI